MGCNGFTTYTRNQRSIPFAPRAEYIRALEEEGVQFDPNANLDVLEGALIHARCVAARVARIAARAEEQA